MSDNIVLKAEDLKGNLKEEDKKNIFSMQAFYKEAQAVFNALASLPPSSPRYEAEKEKIIQIYDTMGQFMQEISAREPRIHVYSFETPSSQHGEVSRLIAKLRDTGTGQSEFIYYIQRAYELLFNLTWGGTPRKKHYLMVGTPISRPTQHYAVHKIPDVDAGIKDTVMCVMLRGALLPSMILSKEIQEYSSLGNVTPFALFSIKRDDTKKKKDMEYVLDLNKSYFDLDSLHGKQLVFADPMNATGGSLVTILKYLMDQGIRPASVKAVNVIASLEGALQVVRTIKELDVYTLWMDPLLNEEAYILPGLGDAGDRINGLDLDQLPRNLIQLIAHYGSNLASLYRTQVMTIEKTVLGG